MSILGLVSFESANNTSTMSFQQISATFEIVTPMFMGDGDMEARIIRPQSFKAELLFWWRALHYSRYVDDANGDQPEALAAMHKDEAFLFGGVEPGAGANGKGKPRQAAFLLAVTNGTLRTIDKRERLAVPGSGLVYLGYGLMNFKGELERSCLAAGERFRISIRFRSSGFDEDEVRMNHLKAQLVDALKIMGLLGGLGSRKRRGFGSIAITGMELQGFEAVPFDVPNGTISYQTTLRSLIVARTRCGRDFSLSAFAKETDVCAWKSSEASALQALEAIGKEFLRYRGWGSGGQAAGSPRRENFKADHDWFKGRPAARVSNAVPERAIFGLPHNYFSPPNTKLDVEVAGGGRRASPLLFHIHNLQNSYLPAVIFFDNEFLPTNEISIDGGGPEVFDPNAAAIRDFLHGNRRATTVTGTVNPALFDKVLP
jgi:CRISPR-associated protein Cmr1